MCGAYGGSSQRHQRDGSPAFAEGTAKAEQGCSRSYSGHRAIYDVLIIAAVALGEAAATGEPVPAGK